MANYLVENQWGGSSAPWHPGGTWELGSRPHQNVVSISISSSDGGINFSGTITYNGEGPIGFKAVNIGGNRYQTQVQWGGSSAPWHPDGVWVIGGRTNQRVVELHVSSSDQGVHLTGTNVYQGEGPIGFRGTLLVPSN